MKDQTVQMEMVTPGQIKDLISAVVQAIPTDMSFATAQSWVGRKGELAAEVRKIFINSVDPSSPAVCAQTFADRLISKTAKLLSKRFGKRITVDPLPVWFKEENLAHAAKYNLRPIFFPAEEISQDREIRNWVKPRKWFYDQIKANKIGADSAQLKRGWYLADFSVGVDYTDGTQVFLDDPLAPIVAHLRESGKIGKYDVTPAGSRFAIKPQSEWPLVFSELALELGFNPGQSRLERAIEFSAIGNIYDKNRGKFNMWEWFSDVFDGSYRLCGGSRGSGGLADVSGYWAGSRDDSIAGRPLVVSGKKRLSIAAFIIR